MRTVFLDTETTGLSPPNDKLVEVAIIDATGDVIIDSLINPGRLIGFATQIHGITDEMVATAPTLEDLWLEISQTVRDSHVVIYNAQFDTKFFPDNLSCAAKISCAMLMFASIYGQLNPRYGDFTWQKLTTTTQFIGYEWVGDTHRALADTRATRALWHWMDGRQH